MMAKSHLRGHRIECRTGRWYYSDTGELADYDRPCKRCGEMPTVEGYDACIGYIFGALSACCGHGVHAPILKMINSERKMADFRERRSQGEGRFDRGVA